MVIVGTALAQTARSENRRIGGRDCTVFETVERDNSRRATQGKARGVEGADRATVTSGSRAGSAERPTKPSLERSRSPDWSAWSVPPTHGSSDRGKTVFLKELQANMVFFIFSNRICHTRYTVARVTLPEVRVALEPSAEDWAGSSRPRGALCAGCWGTRCCGRNSMC